MKHVMALALAFALVVGALAASAQQATTAGTHDYQEKGGRQDIHAQCFGPAQ